MTPALQHRLIRVLTRIGFTLTNRSRNGSCYFSHDGTGYTLRVSDHPLPPDKACRFPEVILSEVIENIEPVTIEARAYGIRLRFLQEVRRRRARLEERSCA